VRKCSTETEGLNGFDGVNESEEGLDLNESDSENESNATDAGMNDSAQAGDETDVGEVDSITIEEMRRDLHRREPERLRAGR